jgi:hypothetical protein
MRHVVTKSSYSYASSAHDQLCPIHVQTQKHTSSFLPSSGMALFEPSTALPSSLESTVSRPSLL